jgi:hypothetical protein
LPRCLFSTKLNDIQLDIHVDLHGETPIIYTHVDDGLCSGPPGTGAAATRVVLQPFPGCDQEKASSALGLTIAQDTASGLIRISQEKLIQEAIHRYDIGEGPCKTPFPLGAALTSATSLPPLSEEEASMYRSMVGTLRYCATMTRPGVCFATTKLAKHMAAPASPGRSARIPLSAGYHLSEAHIR